MPPNINLIRERFEIVIREQHRGQDLGHLELCDDWFLSNTLEPDQELVYFELVVTYLGDGAHSFSVQQFSLEDCEGYLMDAIAPDKPLDCKLASGESGAGGLLFLVYDDIQPVQLWFDTGETYLDTDAPMLIDLAVEKFGARAHDETWKERVALDYDRELEQEAQAGGQLLPLFETRELMDAISRKLRRPYRKLANGYMFQLSLPGGRRQSVLMNFTGKDADDSDLIKFLTICAPAGDGALNHDLFLRMNPQLSYGAIGIITIGGKDFYVLTNTQLAATADHEELIKSIVHLARVGDELEDRLTGGQDVR